MLETDSPTVIITSNVTGLQAAGLDDDDVYIVTVEDTDKINLTGRNSVGDQNKMSGNIYNLNHFDQLPAILRNIKDNICRGKSLNLFLFVN